MTAPIRSRSSSYEFATPPPDPEPLTCDPPQLSETTSPEESVAPEEGQVFLCSEDAEGLAGTLAGLFGIQHQWIRTSAKEAGMNAAPGQDCEICPYETQTIIRDESGRSLKPGAECVPIGNTDEHCIDRELEIGKELGTWTLANQCNAFAASVLEKFSTTPPPPVEFSPSYWGAGMR